MGLRPLACWDSGFESHRGYGCLSLVSVVCCQVEVWASGWSLVQRSPTECGVCNHEAPIMWRPWPTGGFWAMKKMLFVIVHSAVKLLRKETKIGLIIIIIIIIITAVIYVYIYIYIYI